MTYRLLTVASVMGLIASVALSASSALSKEERTSAQRLSSAEMANISGGYGTCPTANNDCNDPPGCDFSHLYWRVFHPMARCEGLLGSCSNNNNKVCYEWMTTTSCTTAPSGHYINSYRDACR